MVLRDSFSSYIRAKLIQGEDKVSLREAIIEMIADLKVSSGAVVRVDGATSMQSLVGDLTLQKLCITLEVGRLKNINKNPEAEKAIQELEIEIKTLCPEGGPIQPSTLAVAVATLNSRIRHRGLSAREILFQRDNDTFSQLNISDVALAEKQLLHRKQNHLSSALSKAPKGIPPHNAAFHQGDLVYVKSEGSKHTGREKYIVSSCAGDYVYIKKLIGSQYRTKEYKMKPTELYPVPFSSISSRLPGYSIKDDSSDDSSSQDEDAANSDAHDDDIAPDSDDSHSEENNFSAEEDNFNQSIASNSNNSGSDSDVPNILSHT